MIELSTVSGHCLIVLLDVSVKSLVVIVAALAVRAAG